MNKIMLLFAALAVTGCEAGTENQSEAPIVMAENHTSDVDAEGSEAPETQAADTTPAAELQTTTLGAGCFWCIEAVLEQVDGIVDVRSGYMGGASKNPTYKEVCTGTSGHAEVVQVDFDPKVIDFEGVLDWFWRLHDPTTLNRQGADTGTQYRSAIFFHSPDQEEAAKASRKAAQDAFLQPIVTEITAVSEFYVAEDYHQDYYRQNSKAGYCRAVIAPKLDKLKLKK